MLKKFALNVFGLLVVTGLTVATFLGVSAVRSHAKANTSTANTTPGCYLSGNIDGWGYSAPSTLTMWVNLDCLSSELSPSPCTPYYSCDMSVVGPMGRLTYIDTLLEETTIDCDTSVTDTAVNFTIPDYIIGNRTYYLNFKIWDGPVGDPGSTQVNSYNGYFYFPNA